MRHPAPADTHPGEHRHTIADVDGSEIERAALVALLRRSARGWSEIAVDAQEAGGALALLRRAVSGTGALFPDEPGEAAALNAAAADLAAWRADGLDVHTCFDQGYPQQLRDIREMPPLLFTRGVRRPDHQAVAVVGSRAASERGRTIARTIATELVERDITVVSGLAAGIDTAVHEATLAAGGRTVAVIGTGLRRHYPPDNAELQARIAEVGLVISQFWPDAPRPSSTFPCATPS